MSCPLCRSRKPRRRCPALGQAICPVCCGTKRKVEIACPVDCPYLASADAHPPAAVRKQRQRDFEFAASLVHRLTDGAYALLLTLQDAVARYRPTTIPALQDPDVAEACGALASTLETSAKGIIYEHQAQSLPAQRVVGELRAVVAAAAARRPGGLERDATEALRRMERGAKTAAAAFGPGATAYLDFLDRLPRELAAAAPADGGGGPEAGAGTTPAGSGLILP